jgi:hypothetical protein
MLGIDGASASLDHFNASLRNQDKKAKDGGPIFISASINASKTDSFHDSHPLFESLLNRPYYLIILSHIGRVDSPLELKSKVPRNEYGS